MPFPSFVNMMRAIRRALLGANDAARFSRHLTRELGAAGGVRLPPPFLPRRHEFIKSPTKRGHDSSVNSKWRAGSVRGSQRRVTRAFKGVRHKGDGSLMLSRRLYH